MDKNKLKNRMEYDEEATIVVSKYDNDGNCYLIDINRKFYVVNKKGEKTLVEDTDTIEKIKEMFKPIKTDVISNLEDNER